MRRHAFNLIVGGTWLILSLCIGGCGDANAPITGRPASNVTLTDAIKAGDAADVKRRIDVAGRLDPKSKEAAELLALAVAENEVEIVKLLLDRGVDANAKNEQGRPLLLVAAASGGAMTATLLDHRASLDARDKGGQTALHVAVAAGRKDAVMELLRRGADVKAVDRSGQTPLHAGIKADTAVLDLLVAAGAQVNCTDVRGSTPLHRAAALGNATAIEWLIKHGADVNAANLDNFTPLYLARAEVVELLKRHGAK
jgi:ankyrin repeat protein